MNAKNVAGMLVRRNDGYEFVFTRVELSSLMEEVGFSKTAIINKWGDSSAIINMWGDSSASAFSLSLWTFLRSSKPILDSGQPAKP